MDKSLAFDRSAHQEFAPAALLWGYMNDDQRRYALGQVGVTAGMMRLYEDARPWGGIPFEIRTKLLRHFYERNIEERDKLLQKLNYPKDQWVHFPDRCACGAVTKAGHRV